MLLTRLPLDGIEFVKMDYRVIFKNIKIYFIETKTKLFNFVLKTTYWDGLYSQKSLEIIKVIHIYRA